MLALHPITPVCPWCLYPRTPNGPLDDAISSTKRTCLAHDKDTHTCFQLGGL